jgi:hypothetical protein
MAETLDKQTLTRLAWITELRRQGHRQCTGAYFSKAGGVCALGLLMEIAIDRSRWCDEEWDEMCAVGALAGLTSDQAGEVALLNDGMLCAKHTFAQIADVVEGWFK